MSEFNFNSQVCTTKVQSERLLALGLKPETADCCYIWRWESESHFLYAASWEALHRTTSDIPAWSLHRLIEMVAHTQYPYYVISKELPIYDALCERIEWLIKDGYFNKEYLV